MAERAAAKAAEEMRRLKEQEENQKRVYEEFYKPPDRTAEQLLELVMQLVNRAAERGQSEVQVYRFPSGLCTDRSRKINNSELRWEETLEGRPKLGYEYWHDHLRPLGFGLRAEILDYPGGMPGDVGFLSHLVEDETAMFVRYGHQKWMSFLAALCTISCAVFSQPAHSPSPRPPLKLPAASISTRLKLPLSAGCRRRDTVLSRSEPPVQAGRPARCLQRARSPLRVTSGSHLG